MKLVIAEKPSVAADLARVLPGSFKQDEGFWEGPDYLVSWAVGHLLELKEPEDYDPALEVWQLATLPILPDPFQRKARAKQGKQLRLLKKLARREEVVSLVNACDAAREGELIFREIEEYVDCGKPVERLWLQSMTGDAISEAFDAMVPADTYEGLGNAAFCRAEADWLIGMNATRGLTRRLRRRGERGVWSAGRVQTPTLAFLAHREVEALAHVPEPFWKLKGELSAGGHPYEGNWRSPKGGKHPDRILDEKEANRIAESCKGKPTEVVEKVKESKRKPPGLYDLTGLQKEANSRYGMSARRALDAAQRLYERHKVLTYPRTGFSGLPASHGEEVDKVLQWIAGGGVEGALVEEDRQAAITKTASLLLKEGLQNQARHFDDAKVGDHHALMPTGKDPESPLGGDDAKVFELVVRRFLGAFLGPSTWENVARETRVMVAKDEGGLQLFRTESRRLVIPGWQGVDNRPKASEVLPPLGVNPGEVAKGTVESIELKEDATRPPQRYTERKLLEAMEKASDLDLDAHGEIEDEDVVQNLRNKGLGTPATRADVIEALVAKGYAHRAGKSLRASAKGITLIDFLERLEAGHLSRAALTAEMELHLWHVEEGTRTRESYMEEVEESVKDLVERLRTFDYGDLFQDEEPIGKCPKDGHIIREDLRAFRCSRISNAAAYKVDLKGRGKEASAPIAEACEAAAAAVLALDGVDSVEALPKRVHGSLVVVLEEAGPIPNWQEKLDQTVMAGAPEGSLIETKVVAEDSDACGFAIWKEFRGRFINKPVALRLLENLDSGPVEGFVNMRGEPYAGRIRINVDFKMEFEAVKGFKNRDDEGTVTPELLSYVVNESPFVECPKCGKGAIVESPTHFQCKGPGEEDGCGLMMPRTVCQREMTRADLGSYFGEGEATDWIEDFTSRKGRPFKARLVRKSNGRHGFEFPPRAPRGKKKAKKE